MPRNKNGRTIHAPKELKKQPQMRMPHFIRQEKNWTRQKIQLQGNHAGQITQTNASSSTEIKSESDLLPPGAPTGAIATDLDQATGLERLEILGKMQGVDIFDMRPLDASRKGT